MPEEGLITRELAELWIEALRSGEYERGQFQLRTMREGVSRYCCLGVLCDLVDPGGWEGTVWKQDDYYASVMPPKSVWSPASGELFGNPTYLSVRNDRGESFEEIADVIESKLDKLPSAEDQSCQ